jgi:hypothetical protein
VVARRPEGRRRHEGFSGAGRRAGGRHDADGDVGVRSRPAIRLHPVLLSTEGKASAELEFDGPPGALVPPDFVTDIGQKQDAAIKKGSAGQAAG